jgi:hypothetical protein
MKKSSEFNNIDFYEVEYGEGGVARAKDVIMNKIGLNEGNTDFLVSQSEKFAIWLADSIVKKMMLMNMEDKKQTIEFINRHPDSISRFYRNEIRQILDWLQHPVTPKQDLRNLTFDKAVTKSREWHEELQVLGGDIDFTEPESNVILKRYHKNDEGIEYYWVFIPSNYCDLESSRMGHCGRTGYGNNLISLRSIKPFGKGHTISDSHVTIAYGVNDGIFYQVKGKKNNKPAEKYFKLIYDLIKSILNGEINQKIKEIKDEAVNIIEDLVKKIKKLEEEILPYISFYLASPSSTEMRFLKGEMSRGDFEIHYDRFISDKIPASDNFQKIYKLNEKLNEVRNNREYEEVESEISRLREEIYSLVTENITKKYKEIIRLELEKKKVESEKDLRYFQFNGFGSEYGDSEDYGYEDMTNEELRELNDLSLTLFTDVNSLLMLFDRDIISSDELKSTIEEWHNNDFKTFGVQMKLYNRGIISEKPSTTFELKETCENVSSLLSLNIDDIVKNILCGDYDDLTDNWSYYYENPIDLVDNLNKVNTDRVIDEIVRITDYEKSEVEINGIAYYLNGEDENFTSDDFDNIIRVLASAQNSADQEDYYSYLYNELKGSLGELGEVHSLNDEGVKMTIDLSNLMSDDDIIEKMEYYDYNNVEDLFYEELGNDIDRPKFSIDDRYSPYGSYEDFNLYVSDTDLESGYEKGGSLRAKKTNKKTKIKNMKPSQRKLEKGGKIETTGVSKEDYFLVVHNWVYFTFNYPMGFVKDAFSSSHLSNHLQEKFSSSYARYGSVGVLMSFWANLDNENRRILSLWIKNNYFSSSSDKSKLLKISDDDYAKIITHWNMFCFNFPYGFIQNVFGDNTSHFEMKWVRAYESAGSTGAVNKFFTELSSDNQRLLTDWVYENYKEMTYERGGNVMKNEDILEQFLISDRELKVNNLSTHFNEYDDELLLRNYGTLIATKKDNQITITKTKFSKTTTSIINKLKNMAHNKKMNVKYVDKFATGGGVDEEEISTPQQSLYDEVKKLNQEEYVTFCNIYGIDENDKDKMLEFIDSLSDREAYEIIYDLNVEDYAKGGGVGVEDELYVYEYQKGEWTVKDKKNPNAYYTLSSKKENAENVRQELIDNPSKLKYYRSNEYAKGGEVDLEYSEILSVLKEKIDEAIDEIPSEYENAYTFKGEEVEHESRDGFIPYTDGGYEAIWFENVGSFYGSGHSLPTKPLDSELNRQIDYSIELAKESFMDKYPELVDNLGEDNINYSSLYDAGYSSEAEELSEMESDSMWEDTIMMRVFAHYYSPDNQRGVDGHHTIRLFGDVNLESPYHRTGNLDDSYEFKFTFSSIDELEDKMDEGITQIINWFNRDMYNDSTAEMKIRRMEDGGEAGKMIYLENPYNENGDFIKGIAKDNISEIMNHVSFRKFGNEFRKHIDRSFTQENNLERVNTGISWSELASYIIGDGDYNVEQEQYENFIKSFNTTYTKNEYAKGGSIKGINKKAEKLLEESISYRWVNTDMGSGWSFELESPLDRSVFNRLEEHTYLDEFSPEDMGIEDWNYLSKEDKEYYYDEWKETLWQSAFESFKEKCMKHLEDFIEYIQQAKEYQDEMNEYAGGGEVQDWMEQALESLIEKTGFDELEITMVSDKGTEFYATDGDGDVEYRVFVNEFDAEQEAIEQVRYDLQDSPENFNQDWLKNYIDGRDFFEEALNEMNQGYVDDIESESDRKYANRLIAELVDNGLMDEEDAESDNAEELADDLKSDYVALLTEGQLDDGNNGLDYFISNFGETETYKMVMDNNLIDVDEASQNAVDTDGIGHFLSSYDGETLYLSDDCVAYRIN